MARTSTSLVLSAMSGATAPFDAGSVSIRKSRWKESGYHSLRPTDLRDMLVNNANLTGALGRFSEAYRVSRAKAYEGIDFEELRGRIAQVKGYAAAHLEDLAAIF